jgi:DNA polymerase-3 subunit delta
MVAFKAAQVDSFIARPEPAQPIVLLFGSDLGLVHERAATLIRSAVADPDDPFSVARLDGDLLSPEPMRLVEEANTVPLFGGRRAVWVKAGSRNLVPAVEALAGASPPDCRVVIEAGDLKRNAPLRVLCERLKNAAALPCYPDAEKELSRLLDEELRADGLTIASDARAMLLPLLGGDRLASRNEIRKLVLYAKGKGRIEIDDVDAAVADASALALDALVDAAFAGRTEEVESGFAKARTAGTSADAIIWAALRQGGALHRTRLAIDGGRRIEAAVEGLYLNFRRKSVVERALRAWSTARLEAAMLQLAEASLQIRRNSDLAAPIAHRALLSIAVQARKG